MGLLHVTYGGNGIVFVDSGLPRMGEIYGIEQNGNLRWYRYQGIGQHNPAGNLNWHANSSNIIGNGWQNFLHVMGGGNGVLYAIAQNGDLHWYQYDGQGESDPSGALGWHANSSNIIGNGWQNFRFVFSRPWEGPADPNKSAIFGVEQNGDLRWYRYQGNGEHDPSGTLGWHPNSGNTVGNGWGHFRHVVAVSDVILAVKEDGDLLYYSYFGDGEHNPEGSMGWHPNSGNTIGNGWQNMRHIFGGFCDSGFRGIVVYAVDQNGDLHWYGYTGNGEHDPSGSQGWHPNSGNVIGNGW